MKINAVQLAPGGGGVGVGAGAAFFVAGEASACVRKSPSLI